LFIKEYLRSGNATTAYHAAGFNGNNPGPNASKMLRKAGIQAFLTKVEKKAVSRVAARLEITVDKVLEDLEEARTVALRAIPSPQCAAAIKASELQGKHIGMFRDDYADRDQMPLISITTGDGTRIAMMSPRQAALMPPQPLPDGVDEVLTDDDFL
jgi:phage terminase small subunit